MHVRQVDGAGSEVNESHRDALIIQSRKLVDIDPAELEVVDEIGWFGTTEAKGEVFRVEQRDLLLQDGKKNQKQIGGSTKIVLCYGGMIRVIQLVVDVAKYVVY